MGKLINEDELKSKQFKTARTIAYPIDGTFKTAVKSGKWRFNFMNGEVTTPDNKTDDMSTKLEKIGDKRIRSILIIVSDPRTKITLGANEISNNSKDCVYVINGIEFQTLVLDFPTGNVPEDNHAFLICGCTASEFCNNVERTILQYTPAVITTPLLADAHQTVLQFHFPPYARSDMIIRNVGAVNSLTYQIGYSNNGIFWNNVAEVPIAALASGLVAITLQFKFVRIQIRRTTAALDTTYELYPNLTK
jgi:hypothetical protein